jgi:predicted DNA-binding transcriptional regulator YafY
VEAEIPPKELDYLASRLLSVGTDVIVESPPELVEAVRYKAREVARLYDRSPTRGSARIARHEY